VLGGIVLSLAPGAPISAFVTTLSFVIYLVCRAIAAARGRVSGRVAQPVSVPAGR